MRIEVEDGTECGGSIWEHNNFGDFLKNWEIAETKNTIVKDNKKAETFRREFFGDLISIKVVSLAGPESFDNSGEF